MHKLFLTSDLARRHAKHPFSYGFECFKDDTPPSHQQGRYCAMDRVQILWAKILLQRVCHKWCRAQKILLQHTTGKSRNGELALMALCDIHVAGCGEHLPAWGLHTGH